MSANANRIIREEDLHVRRLVQALEDMDYLNQHRIMRGRAAALSALTAKFFAAQRWLQRNRIRKQLQLI